MKTARRIPIVDMTPAIKINGNATSREILERVAEVLAEKAWDAEAEDSAATILIRRREALVRRAIDVEVTSRDLMYHEAGVG